MQTRFVLRNSTPRCIRPSVSWSVTIYCPAYPIEAFKTLNGFNRVEKNAWFEIETDDQRPTRRNVVIEEGGERRKTIVLKVETARLEVRKHFFNVRAANTWNNIPEEVRVKKTVNGFKAAYDGWKSGTQTEV